MAFIKAIAESNRRKPADQAQAQQHEIPETARILSLTESSIRSKIARGEIPVVRLGRRVFVTHETLELLLRGQLFGGGRAAR
jgi:hypothetical protein